MTEVADISGSFAPQASMLNNSGYGLRSTAQRSNMNTYCRIFPVTAQLPVCV